MKLSSKLVYVTKDRNRLSLKITCMMRIKIFDIWNQNLVEISGMSKYNLISTRWTSKVKLLVKEKWLQ